MPAHTKYLSKPGQRALKITAAIFGGYLVSASFHLMLACIPSAGGYVILISGISFFLVWAGLMVCSFLFRSGWKAWGAYLALTLLFGGVVWLVKFLPQN